MANARQDSGLRLDIQGLRAIAVLAVVLFHAHATWLPGGFVGVDMFFVISGFLITGLLRRELTSGRPRVLRGFFVKRLRRLFPAAAVVITATLIAAYIVTPVTRFREFGLDAISSLVYLSNVRFSLSNTGYFANDIPTPFLHLWSLSVEEQFYIALALLMVALRRVSTRVVFWVLLGLLMASFAASIVLSALQADFAYYHLPTRGWQFLVGSVLSLSLPFWQRAGAAPLAALRILGLILITVSLILINETMPFPGWVAAIPTLGAALVIAAGSGPRGRPAPDWARYDLPRRVLESRPVTYVGDMSYSLYLWHWPLVILPLVATGEPLPVRWILVAVAASFVLGALTYHFVERPIRIHKGATFSVPRNLVLTTGTALLICSVAYSFMYSTERTLTRLTTLTLGPTTAAPVNPGGTLDTPVGNYAIAPAATLSPLLTNAGVVTDPLQVDCMNQFADATVRVCSWAPAGGGSKRILLFGDSQINMLWPMFRKVAEERGYELDMIVKAGCPPSDIEPFKVPGLEQTCPVWLSAALAKVTELQPDLIVYGGHSQDLQNTIGLSAAEFNQKWAADFASFTQKLPAASQKLFVTDRPIWRFDPIECISRNLENPAECDTPLAEMIDPQRIQLEEAALAPLGVSFLNLRDGICPEGTCHAVYQNYITYSDGIHLTAAFSEALAPYAWVPVSEALGEAP
ncbi:acyltransferase [Micrococcales bacterium 31B]|nr:acyltransferase [Micrococcales bacterium 31B]